MVHELEVGVVKWPVQESDTANLPKTLKPLAAEQALERLEDGRNVRTAVSNDRAPLPQSCAKRCFSPLIQGPPRGHEEGEGQGKQERASDTVAYDLAIPSLEPVSHLCASTLDRGPGFHRAGNDVAA